MKLRLIPALAIALGVSAAPAFAGDWLSYPDYYDGYDSPFYGGYDDPYYDPYYSPAPRYYRNNRYDRRRARQSRRNARREQRRRERYSDGIQTPAQQGGMRGR